MERRDLKQALVRLLGAGAPEIGCDDFFAQVDRYVELEVSGGNPDAGVPGSRAHLEGCPTSCEEYESLRALVSDEQAL